MDGWMEGGGQGKGDDDNEEEEEAKELILRAWNQRILCVRV